MLLQVSLLAAIFTLGFMAGYATRAAISHHRRQQAQQRGLMYRNER